MERVLVASRSDNLPLPKNLADCEELGFWIHSKASAENPLVLDVMISERDRRAAFWRKLEVTEPGWQKVSMPLAWFRWETGRAPRWNAVSNFVLRTRGPAEFSIDQIDFIDKDPKAGSEYRPEELSEFAFGPGNSAARSRITDAFWLITDSPDLDLEALGKHLEGVLENARKELHLDGKPNRPARLVIFNQEDDYRGFVPRFAEKLGAGAPNPKSDGYHVQGIALSYWKPELGTLRPVFTHEFMHSVLSNYMLIDSSHADWWQEGLASTYQLRAHPQADFWAMVREGLEDPQKRAPLELLCSGRDIPMHRYWQAATLVDMLLCDPAYSPNSRELMDAMRKTGSTDLRPLLEPLYGKTWNDLTMDWARWCVAKVKASDQPAAPPEEFK
jgi:hypothetical protein